MFQGEKFEIRLLALSKIVTVVHVLSLLDQRRLHMCHDASSKFLHKLFNLQQQKMASVSFAEEDFQYRMAFDEGKKV